MDNFGQKHRPHDSLTHTNGITGPHLKTLEKQHTTITFKGWLKYISCVKALLSVMFALCVSLPVNICAPAFSFAHFAVAVGVKVW